MDESEWVTAEEAAEILGVKRETVYAYVSRGRLTSRAATDGRGRVLSRADVDKLGSRTRKPKRIQGMREPNESAITFLSDGAVYYRGVPASQLAAERTFESVAEFLWGQGSDAGSWEAASAVLATYERVVEALPQGSLPVDMIRIAGACISAFDPPEPHVTRRSLIAGAKRYLTTVLSAIPALSVPTQTPRGGPKLAALLWSRLNERQATQSELAMLNSAMVMLADHDMARSTVAVRTAARVGVDAGGLIDLGMASSGGPVKGVASLAVEAFLHNIASSDAVEMALTRRLKQGETVPGFGHPMYPSGDPRAEVILDELRSAAKDVGRMATVEEVLRTQASRGMPAPNAGFALAAMTYVTGMIAGSGETIFVVARTAGWIAHALEALEMGVLERLTSTYVGPTPREQEVG